LLATVSELDPRGRSKRARNGPELFDTETDRGLHVGACVSVRSKTTRRYSPVLLRARRRNWRSGRAGTRARRRC